MTTYFDLHIHTEYSYDGVTSIRELLKIAVKKGIRVLGVTDHNTIEGGLKAYKLSKEGGYNLIVIPGIEVSTKYGHLIALNVFEEIRRKGSIFEIIEEIHKKGGISIAAHPFDIIMPFKNLNELSRYIDAIEYANALTINFKEHIRKAEEHLREYNNLGYSVGSDSHIPDTIGNVVGIYEEEVERIDDVIDVILNRKLSFSGKRTKLYHRIKKIFLTKLRVRREVYPEAKQGLHRLF